MEKLGSGSTERGTSSRAGVAVGLWCFLESFTCRRTSPAAVGLKLWCCLLRVEPTSAKAPAAGGTCVFAGQFHT